MSKREFDARIRKGVRAIEGLHKAIEACEQAELTRDEMLSLLPADGDQSVILNGSLFDQLHDRDAKALLQVVYRALDDGAAFVFSVARRTEEEIRKLCGNAGIGDLNVKISRDARSLRVALVKLQS
ncbi:MAG TPA: hypothetical protein VGQ36_23745 [Thermoanaerobaculia bacterium]|nr:hypothetical protein [Thermoanaerobaculia bacterium]